MSRSFRHRHMPRPRGVKKSVNYTQSGLRARRDLIEDGALERYRDEIGWSAAYDLAKILSGIIMSTQNVWDLHYLGYGARFMRSAKKYHRTEGNRRWRHHDTQLCHEIGRIATAEAYDMIERTDGLHFMYDSHPLLEVEFMRKHTAWNNYCLT